MIYRVMLGRCLKVGKFVRIIIYVTDAILNMLVLIAWPSHMLVQHYIAWLVLFILKEAFIPIQAFSASIVFICIDIYYMVSFTGMHKGVCSLWISSANALRCDIRQVTSFNKRHRVLEKNQHYNDHTIWFGAKSLVICTETELHLFYKFNNLY